MARYLARLFLGYLAAAAIGAALAIGYSVAARPGPEMRAYGPPAAFCHSNGRGVAILCMDAPHDQRV